ncbi:MAG: hypothetical protein PUF72_03325 [Clostridiales bacterium]|nr:hypothetical protein [Clostridiales bacterium]
MLYLRRFFDLLLISVIPSLLSMFFMWQLGSYYMWISTAAVSAFLFYACDILLLRRFIYDIKSPARYFTVQLVAWALNSALAFFLLYMRFANVLSGMFFYSRVFEVLSTNEATKLAALPTRYSMMISFGINLVLIFVMYPVFSSTKKKLMQEEELDSVHITNREVMEAKRAADEDEQQEFHLRNAVVERTATGFWGLVLNMWSYGFYQAIITCADEGRDPRPMIKNYLKRRFTGSSISTTKIRRKR